MRARVDAIVREHERMAAAIRKLGATVVAGHGNCIGLSVGEL
jgi:hypothetical protein